MNWVSLKKNLPQLLFSFDLIFSAAPAQFADRDQQISVRSGEKAILQCRAKGDLPIDIQWSNKHTKIGSHSNHRSVFVTII